MNPDLFITIVFVAWAMWTAAGVALLIRANMSSREPDGVADEPRAARLHGGGIRPY